MAYLCILIALQVKKMYGTEDYGSPVLKLHILEVQSLILRLEANYTD